MTAKVYELKLHDVTAVGSTEIMRVPGGWLYSVSAWSDNGQQFPNTTVFVPFNNEFQLQEELQNDRES